MKLMNFKTNYFNPNVYLYYLKKLVLRKLIFFTSLHQSDFNRNYYYIRFL